MLSPTDYISVKVRYGEEVRRVEVHHLSFDLLKRTIQDLFPSVPPGADTRDAMSLTYVDDDGDTITVSSEGELRTAARVLAGCAVMKFSVVLGSTLPVPPTRLSGSSCELSLPSAFTHSSPPSLVREESEGERERYRRLEEGLGLDQGRSEEEGGLTFAIGREAGERAEAAEWTVLPTCRSSNDEESVLGEQEQEETQQEDAYGEEQEEEYSEDDNEEQYDEEDMRCSLPCMDSLMLTRHSSQSSAGNQEKDQDKELLWGVELAQLAAMGFTDQAVLLPLLQRHVKVPGGDGLDLVVNEMFEY